MCKIDGGDAFLKSPENFIFYVFLVFLRKCENVVHV